MHGSLSVGKYTEQVVAPNSKYENLTSLYKAGADDVLGTRDAIVSLPTII